MRLEHLLREHMRILLVPVNQIPIRRRNNDPQHRTIDSFNESQCYRIFRCTNEELHRWFDCMGFPDEVVLDNGVKLTGEEVFLFGLHRYGYPGRLEDLADAWYGREYTVWSRAFKWFNQFIVDNWLWKITDNMEFWKDRLADLAYKNGERYVAVSGERYDPYDFRTALFIDCTVIATTRPGAGPTESGARKNNYIQMAFYNGWKKHHGFKYQTLELPNGLAAHMFGSLSVLPMKTSCMRVG